MFFGKHNIEISVIFPFAFLGKGECFDSFRVAQLIFYEVEQSAYFLGSAPDDARFFTAVVEYADLGIFAVVFHFTEHDFNDMFRVD